MKRILCIILTIMMTLTLVSCGSSGNDPEPQPLPEEGQMTPVQTADAFLKAFKSKDTEKMKEYYEGEISDLSMIEEEDDSAMADLINAMVEKILDFDYSLGNETIKGDEASVEVNFTTYDFSGILQDIMNNLMSDAVALGLSGLSQEEMEAEINELIGSKFSAALDSADKDWEGKVTMDLVKKDSKWLVKDVSGATSFMNALSGGLMDFAESLNDN